MSDLDDRIARFEHMARADPENEMAHFSLGSAYLQAGRAAEAATAFQRCTAINPDMSKAWQMAGEALIKAGWTDKAVEVLTKGYEIAAGKGDRMPQQAMADLLRSIGREPPPPRPPRATESKAGAGGFVCRRTGRKGTQLPRPPFRGPIGQWIYENIAAETWQGWIGQGTKVINELRLDFSRDEDQQTYDRYMCEYPGIDDALKMRLLGEQANTR